MLLPAAEFLGAEHRAPGRALIDAGAIVVLATDANPGTSPVFSMPVVIGLGSRLYGLGVREALGAATLNAAWTLDLHHDRGSIEVGKRADLVVLDGPVESIAYRFGHNPVAIVVIGGEVAYVRDDAAASGSGLHDRTARIPAMANAHSHAFQLDLRGIGERLHPGDDFWSWRTEMYRLASSSHAGVDARGRRPRLRPDGRRRLRRRRRVSLRPPPARRDAVRRAQRDGDRAGAGGARGRPGDHAAPRRLSPRRAPASRPRPGRSASATRRWRRSWNGWTRCASGPPASTG